MSACDWTLFDIFLLGICWGLSEVAIKAVWSYFRGWNDPESRD